MQRVRIGLTGLSCVFLLVLLAAAFLGFANREAGQDAPANGDVVAADTNSVAPSDPLAELGVAPGSPQSASPENMSAAP